MHLGQFTLLVEATICQPELSEVLQLKPSPEYLLGGKWYYLQRGPLVMNSEKSL